MKLQDYDAHISLDLETIGTGSNAGILAIGAVKFDPFVDPFTNTPEHDDKHEFYVNLNIEEGFKQGLYETADISSFYWWLQQSDAARKAVFNPRRMVVPPSEAFVEFLKWAWAPSEQDHFGAEKREVIIWGNGNTFDNVILRNAMTKSGVQYPASFRDDLDIRTIAAAANSFGDEFVMPNRVGTVHDALDDARWQARYAKRVLHSLKGDRQI